MEGRMTTEFIGSPLALAPLSEAGIVGDEAQCPRWKPSSPDWPWQEDCAHFVGSGLQTLNELGLSK
jgi:hypothetical protein